MTKKPKKTKKHETLTKKLKTTKTRQDLRKLSVALKKLDEPNEYLISNDRMAIIAQDYFRGKIPESQRIEVANGLMRAVNFSLIAQGSTSSIFFLSTGIWDIFDKILDLIRKAAGTNPISISSGQVIAIAIAVYYFRNPPNPTSCSPRRLDLWRHCYVGCKIAFWAPAGWLHASKLAAVKEILDALGLGTADIDDIIATLKGAVWCGFFETCEECCCEKNF